MAENISQVMKTLDKTLKLINDENKRRDKDNERRHEEINDENKRRDKDNERRHEEMEKMLELSTTKTDLIRQGIQKEMEKTREMIKTRYDYFSLLMSYLTAMMTGLLIYFVITPIETPEYIKSVITLIFTIGTASLVLYMGYRTHHRSNIVGISTETK